MMTVSTAKTASKSRNEQIIERLIAQLHEVAGQWRRCLRQIGEVLVKLEEHGEPAHAHVIVLREEYGLPRTSSLVAIRWASGKLGSEAESLVTKIKHSVLAEMTEETIGEITSGKHTIYLGDGGVGEKSFKQMSRKEVRRNINIQGFIPLGAHVTTEPTNHYFVAERFEQPENGKPGVIFVGQSSGTTRVLVSPKLFRQASENLIETNDEE